MKPTDWISIAKSTVKLHERHLGSDFVPPNMQKLLPFEAEAQAIDELRKSIAEHKNKPMISYLHEVSKAVKTHKTGCCGELAMAAFNFVRVHEPSALILEAPGTGDFHAFLIMGALDSYYDEVSIDRIAEDWPDAIIVDFWASCHKNTVTGMHGRGVFKVGEYRRQASCALQTRSYDTTKCKIFTPTGKSNTPGFAAVNFDRVQKPLTDI
jgi:hypothetical protein